MVLFLLCCIERKLNNCYLYYRSLLLEKSSEIIRLRQENDSYKSKYAQEIKEKDKEISSMFI